MKASRFGHKDVVAHAAVQPCPCTTVMCHKFPKSNKPFYRYLVAFGPLAAAVTQAIPLW
eukprot:COSAG02_NODE_6608_length_3462_cov_2.289028_2_plen_59_part_00